MAAPVPCCICFMVFGGIEFSWELYGKASAILDDLLQKNAIMPMLVVMPFGFKSNEQKFRRKFPSKDWLDGHMLGVLEVV